MITAVYFFYGATWLKISTYQIQTKTGKELLMVDFSQSEANILITKHPVKFMYGTEPI